MNEEQIKALINYLDHLAVTNLQRELFDKFAATVGYEEMTPAETAEVEQQWASVPETPTDPTAELEDEEEPAPKKAAKK